MGKRTSHPHGAFSWADNATTDQDGSKAFYTAVFGWDYRDAPIGDGAVYSMALKDGVEAAAIAPQQPDEPSQGIPPHWNNYVTVDDVDAVSARVNELGGNLVVPPFDVMDVGRMSVLVDPVGGVLCLWEARESIGARVVNEPGALSWNDLNTQDVEAAKTFYGELFGWTFEKIPNIEVDYWVIKNGDRSNGGIVGVHEGIPSFWVPYFGVDSIDAAIETVKANGGKVFVEKTPTGGNNSFAVLSDPIGAAFAIVEGDFDD